MSKSNRALLLLTCLTMLTTGAMESMKSFLPLYFESRYGFGSSASGTVFAASFIGLMLANLAAGRIVGAIGWQRAFVLHMILYSAGWWLCALVAPGIPIVWTFLFFGIGFANGINGMISNIIGPLFDRRRAVQTLGRIHFFFGCGLIAGPLVYARLHAEPPGEPSVAGWTAVFAAFGLLAAALALFALRIRWPASAHADTMQTMDSGGGEKPPARILAILAIIYFCYMGAESGITVWYLTLLTEHHRFDANAAAVMYALGFAAFTLMRLASHWIIRRLGFPGACRLVCLAGIGCLVWAHTAPGPAGAAGYIAFLLVVAIVFPLLTASSIQMLGRHASRWMGTLLAAGFIGGAFSSWLIGWLRSSAGIDTAFIVVTLLFAGFCVALPGLPGMRRNKTITF